MIHTEIFLPPNAPPEYADRQILWNAVEKCEQGKKAQLAYSFDITLQVELSMEENIDLARRFVQEQLVSKGMIADLAIHLPEKKEGGIPNPHFHVMVPIRPLNPDGTWGQKQRREYKLDEHGNRIRNEKGQYVFNAVHSTDWNTPETLEGWRSAWCNMVNTAFAEKGLDCRIDHRSYERQGIEKIPTIHEGPKVRQMEKRGIETEKGSFNRWVKATNHFLATAKEKLTEIRKWISELKEILAPPAERNLVSILSAYYRKRNEGAIHLSRKTANLKSMNRIMNYLLTNKIATVSDLETFFDGVYGKYHDLGDSIRQKDDRRKDLTELLRCSENRKKYQPVFDELQTIRWKGKKEKYKVEHDRELTIYHAARRTLKENPGNPAAWCKELEQIETETAELNQQRGELYGDVQMLFQIQNAVNQVLHEEQKAERQQSLHPTYRHNRKDENLE